MSGFQIAEVAVAAGWLALCPVPGASGDYVADLRALAAWSPDMVLSLTDRAELAAAGAAALADDLAARRIAWRHFAIPDFGVPDAASDHAWPILADDLTSCLGRGGRLLVHCRGGCGRSGMVALRLMIAQGEAPDAALARLRAARPCAIETPAQMRWAKGQKD